MEINISKTENKIYRSMMISELVQQYPEVVNYLVTEWGFHCVNCYVQHFETLEEGATVHGILGDEFELMLEKCNEIINRNTKEI